MGGGDLNMKKSWHPLIRKNVERVWQEENRARDERKRIEQKRKEIAEERQLQDLQRLQESQGGKPRQERMDWMYASPSSGGQGTSESMEQYLLGKKTVDQLLQGDEAEKLKRGTESGFIVMQNANSVVDTRNKILNDPLLAIKKQEQRQFEELMKNPLRLKQMRREMEKKTGSVKHEEVGDGRRTKKHRRHREDSRERSEHRRERDDDYRSSKRRRSNDRDRSDDISHSDDKYRQSRSTRNVNERSSHSEPRDNDHRRHRSPPRSSFRRHSPTKREQSSDRRNSDEERETALQAMLSNAEQLESSRALRLAELETKDKEEQEREEIKRLQKTGLGQRAGFMRDFQGRILEEGKMAAVR